MQYDKEFHLYHNSWDAYRKSVEKEERERKSKRVCVYGVCVYVCALVKQGPIFSILPPTAS